MESSIKKNLSIRAFSVFLLITGSVASASEGLNNQELVLNVTPIALENSDHVLPDQTICFTQEWADVDPGIQSKILALRNLVPQAFDMNGTANPNLCYDPKKVPLENQEDFNLVLALIQSKAGNNAVINLATEHSPEPIILRNQEKSLGKKLLRATAVVQGSQLAGMGILLMLPSSINKWNEKPMKDAWAHIQRAYSTYPVWDRDNKFINYVGHPVSGGIYYNMIRSQGATSLQSFLYSTSQSVFWEYVVEVGAEQPSIQDLLFTSTIGSVLGELGHRATLKMAKDGFTLGEKALIVILNPAYLINNGFQVKRGLPAAK